MKSLKYILSIGVAALVFAACRKDDSSVTGDSGTARIKIMEAPTNKLFFSAFTNVDTFSLFSLRRDEVSSSAIAQSITVKLSFDQDAIDAYNDENGTEYEVMPDSIYSIATSNVKVSGTDYSITIPAGTIAQEMYIAMNGAKWDLAHKYAFSFTITDSAGKHIEDGQNSVLVTVEAKNAWDGIYKIAGTMVDASSTALVGLYDDPGGYGAPEYSLETISPTECVVVDYTYYGSVDIPIWSTSSAAPSYYGSFGLVLKFDPATNKVVSVTNYYGQPASNTRSAQLADDGVNAYDPDEKTITIKYYMLQPSVITTAPYIRTTWDEVWTYDKSR